MKPKRPDSAKSHVTKQTQDSEPTKKDLNSSKFSQTFTSGVNSVYQKGDQFKQYVAQKDKDPRFKHLKPKLQPIPQKTNEVEKEKTSYKPFEKKKEKTIDKTNNKKIQQKTSKPQKQEEQLSLSRGFAQKNKLKMNSLKLTMSQQKQQDQKIKESIRSKIKFDAFKFNKPGEKKQLKKVGNQTKAEQNRTSTSQQTNQVKKEKKSSKKTQEEIRRQNEYKNIERYVNDVEARNIMNFPRNYDQFVNNSSNLNVADLQKINLNDFMNQLTEGDYQLMKAKIRKMDNQLQEDESVDLESLINTQEAQQLKKEEDDNNSLIYASMSASDMKKRNAFITQILAGKISQNQIDKLQQMQKTSMRMYKIQRQKQEEDVEFTQINLVKRQSNRLMERNRIEAAGQLYRDCDYLSEQDQQRIQELLNGEIGPSPFECDELQGMRRKRIDGGIRMYREMLGSEQTDTDPFNQESLPRDPKLRKEAEDKILKERVSNINQRISETGKIVVTKAKIQTLIKKYADTRPSSNYQQIHQQNQQRFEEEMRVLAEAENMLKGLSNRQDVDEIIGQIEMKYRELQAQIKRYNQLDEKELVKMEKQRLKDKMKEVEKVQRLSRQCESQIGQIEKIKSEIEDKLRLYDQLQEIRLVQVSCEGYKAEQTLQDIDAIITKKWKQSQYANNTTQ